MAPRQVIQDSEDDGSGTSADSSPEKNGLAAQSGSTDLDGSVAFRHPQNCTDSTDPVFFQHVYEDHLKISSQQPNKEPQSPILKGPFTSGLMSSSPVPVSIRNRLKRSKTMSTSLLTSVTEPTASNQKAKRARSMKDVVDLTQITSPRKSKDMTERDPWEFVGSSPSDTHLNVDARVESRKASLKTYEKLNRRSKTMDIRSSLSQEFESPRQLVQQGFGSPTAAAKDTRRQMLKRPACAHDDDDLLPVLQKSKRRRGLSVNSNLLIAVPGEPHSSNSQVQDGVVESSILKSTATTVQVPRSTSEEVHREKLIPLVDSVAKDAENQLLLEQADADVDLAPNSPPLLAGTNNMNYSRVIIPDTLTNSQKRQYQTVNVTLSSVGRPSSLPDMMDTVDHNLRFVGDSSTVPNETPIAGVSSTSTQASISPAIISSGSQMQAAYPKLKRAKSMASQPPDSSKPPTSSDKSMKLKRSKTIGPREDTQFREQSIDELTFDPSQFSKRADIKIAPAKTGKQKANKTMEEERGGIDELFDSDQIRKPREICQPRSSLRRSKSLSADPITDLDLHFRETVPSKQKRSKRSKSMRQNAVLVSTLEPSLPKPSHASLQKGLERPIAQPQQNSPPNSSPHLEPNLERLNGIRLKFSEAKADVAAQHHTDEKDFTSMLDTVTGSASMDSPGESGSTQVRGDNAPDKQEPVLGSSIEEVLSLPTIPEMPKRRGRPKKLAHTHDDLDNNKSLETAGVEKEFQNTLRHNQHAAHPEADDEQVSLIPTEPVLPEPKRRGRPKKIPELSTEAQNAQVAENNPLLEDPLQSNIEPLHEVTGNKNKALGSRTLQEQVEPPNSTPSRTQPTDSLLAKTTPPKSTTETPASAQLPTPTRDSKKGADQHSPLQSGKVPYRVGLSKNRRIAPLLKIIKK